MIRRIVSCTVCIPLILSVALGACGKDRKQAEQSAAAPAGSAGESRSTAAVTLQLNWTPEPEFGGFYAAVHDHLYEREGLDVSIKAGGAGVQTWKMVATGAVPFAIAEAGEILRARLKDADLVALYAVYQTSPQALMVHKDSGVTSLAEVFTSGKIKRVAMESGLPYVKFLQKRYGFDKVEVVQHGGNLTLFLNDPTMAQQCFAFAEPLSAKEKGVEVSVFSTAEAGFNPYLAVVITSSKYLADHRAQVEGFVRATRAGWKAYLDSAVPTNEYLKTQQATMTLPAMNAAADLQKPYVVGDDKSRSLGSMTEERWKALADQLHDLGEIEQVPDVTKAFVNIESK
ncbi:MAG TPA: ABC transporter substrate-binding protein [Kofleriaceae bacterium]|nr:ABC transporter substrate-binding protein [Kofleriaceae bacterium]